MENIFLLLGNVGMTVLFTTMTFLFKKYPPQKINHIYGYRTRRSMKNSETWIVANDYSTKQMFKWSLMIIPMHLLAYLIWGGTTAILVVSFLWVVMLIGVMIATERHLKATFGD